MSVHIIKLPKELTYHNNLLTPYVILFIYFIYNLAHLVPNLSTYNKMISPFSF